MKSSVRCALAVAAFAASGCNLLVGDFTTSQAVGSWKGPITTNPNPTTLRTSDGKPCTVPGPKCMSFPVFFKPTGGDCSGPMEPGCVRLASIVVGGIMTINGDRSGSATFAADLILEAGGAMMKLHADTPGTLTWDSDGTQHLIDFKCTSLLQCDPRAQSGHIPIACVNPDKNTLACTRQDTNGEGGVLQRSE
jgi:hypothetical protein